jgi:hypothetical protein
MKDFKAVAFPKTRVFPIRVKATSDDGEAGEDKLNSANK